jgi:hypothetical protein
MKYIAKMMLAALASVALAVPAYAWDFSASGSVSAGWKQTSVAPASGDATTSMDFSGSSGGVSLKSSHTDGDNSYTLTYTADVDTDGTMMSTTLPDNSTGLSGWASSWGSAGLDQTLSLAGSKKVGKWTASATASQSLMEDSSHQEITADDSAVITLTDGSITHKLGSAAHLSTAEKTSATTAAGAQDAEARVDSFNGYSVGMGLGGGSFTFAIDMNSGAATELMGDKTVTVACGGQMTGFGFNYSGNVGADLSFTYASGSAAASAATCTGDNSGDAAAGSTMGLGVSIPAGPATVALDYESTSVSTTVASAETTVASGGFEISAKVADIADGTVVLNISNSSSKTGDADAVTKGGTELGWSTTVGPVGLEVAYGSEAVTDGDTTTELEVEMTLSF